MENDNDKATKYFKDPQDSMKQKYSAAQLQSIDFGETKKVVLASDGNELIEKLKQQSIDNKEKNDKIVRAKTLQNDMVRTKGLKTCCILYTMIVVLIPYGDMRVLIQQMYCTYDSLIYEYVSFVCK